MLDLGTGPEAFEPLEDGGPILFYFGPQGGYHVFASLRASDLPPGNPLDPFGPESPLVTIQLTVDDVVIGGLVQQPRLFVVGSSGTELLGQQVVMEIPDPPSLAGKTATLSAEVQHPCGLVATDSHDVVLTLFTGS